MKIYHYILTAILALAAGCTSSYMPAPDIIPADVCELVISISTEGTAERETRSGDIWDDPYPEEQGIPSEREIRHMSMYLVTKAGSIIPLQPSGFSGEDGTYQYKTNVNLNADYIDTDNSGNRSISGRITAIANFPGGMIPANPFSTPAYSISSIDEYGVIPMWGVATISSLRLEADKTVHAGTIKMLRSVPKVTIEIKDELKDEYRITKVIADQKGYKRYALCHPAGSMEADHTGALLIDGCFNPAADNTDAGIHVYGLGTDKIRFYPAERECPVTEGIPLSFTVTLERKDGTAAPFSGKVYLCDYIDGVPDFDSAFGGLVRNHDYKYRIALSELEFIISFKEWVFGGKVHIELE